MDNIIDFSLNINGIEIPYHVSFENEAYHFTPKTKENEWPVFNLKREHTEWLVEPAIEQKIKQQAIEKLDKYLLSQS